MSEIYFRRSSPFKKKKSSFSPLSSIRCHLHTKDRLLWISSSLSLALVAHCNRLLFMHHLLSSHHIVIFQHIHNILFVSSFFLNFFPIALFLSLFRTSVFNCFCFHKVRRIVYEHPHAKSMKLNFLTVFFSCPILNETCVIV